MSPLESWSPPLLPPEDTHTTDTPNGWEGFRPSYLPSAPEVQANYMELQEQQRADTSALEHQQKKERLTKFKEEGEAFIKSGDIECLTDINRITESLDSERLDMMMEFAKELLFTQLDEYSFLDTKTKNIIQIGFINQVLDPNSPIKGTLESLQAKTSSFIEETAKSAPGEAEAQITHWLGALQDNPFDVGESKDLLTQIQQKWEAHTKAFTQLQEQFTEREITNGDTQKAIISHIDYFRDPSLISQGALDISKLDPSVFEQIEGKDFSVEDLQRISDATNLSREKLETIGTLMNVGDRASETLYGLMQSENIGPKLQKFLGFIMKEVPFLGKMLAAFLGLTSDNPEAELMQNTKLFPVHTSLKSLGKTDKNEGIEPFKNISLQKLNFNVLKNPLASINEIANISSNKPEDQPKIWESLFSENGLEINGISLKIDLTEQYTSDGEIKSAEMKEILEISIGKYREQKAVLDEQKAANEQAKKQQETQAQLQEMQRKQQEEQRALSLATQKRDVLEQMLTNKPSIQIPDTIFRWTEASQMKVSDLHTYFSDISDTNNALASIVQNSLLDEITATEKSLSTGSLQILLSAIHNFAIEHITSGTITLQEVVQNFQFQIYIEDEVKKLQETHSTQTAKLQETASTIQAQQQKVEQATQQQQLQQALSTPGSLSEGIELGETLGKLLFDSEKQTLTLGENTYTINLQHDGKNISIQDIKLTDVQKGWDLIPEDGLKKLYINGKRMTGQPSFAYISPSQMTQGIQNIIEKGDFTHTDGGTQLTITKQATA